MLKSTQKTEPALLAASLRAFSKYLLLGTSYTDGARLRAEYVELPSQTKFQHSTDEIPAFYRLSELRQFLAYVTVQNPVQRVISASNVSFSSPYSETGFSFSDRGSVLLLMNSTGLNTILLNSDLRRYFNVLIRMSSVPSGSPCHGEDQA